MVERPVYIITFNSANSSMVLYRLLRDAKLQVYMIQTPCCLSAGCARSIEVNEDDIEKVINIIKRDNVDIGAIHKKYVNEDIRRYAYEEVLL